ncbi:DUF2993 domain-containing protein [Streptomyces sp. NBC_00820]|uniref:LmeA family phospholipid-binding protein n=1 Tax=Streptomyces sp. NBC_00820 TaxID=2975842 RepID=UPI002ED4E2C8|nr:DUF2993 domain-containing protein [Streptomyces sp. NBC_00820]
MRALRILLILVVILGGLFVVADRLAVNLAEGQVADKLKARQNLASTPDVSIKGFPFLTQVAGGSLDDVEVGIKNYEAAAGTSGKTVRIDDLKADMKGVAFSGDYSSATAASATGTATIAYDQLLKTTQSEPASMGPGVSARVVGLTYGGNDKIKVALQVSVPALDVKQTVQVLSSVTVRDGKVQVHADSLPALGGADVAESRVRRITDFQQVVDQLPGGIKIDEVTATQGGLEIGVAGSDVRLAG